MQLPEQQSASATQVRPAEWQAHMPATQAIAPQQSLPVVQESPASTQHWSSKVTPSRHDRSPQQVPPAAQLSRVSRQLMGSSPGSRTPQSPQSVPKAQSENTESAPPSSQVPLPALAQLSAQSPRGGSGAALGAQTVPVRIDAPLEPTCRLISRADVPGGQPPVAMGRQVPVAPPSSETQKVVEKPEQIGRASCRERV